MKVWEMEETDVMRFVLSRAQWVLLIEAIAGAAGRTAPDSRGKLWDALEVLRHAEEDVDALAMTKALTEIVERTKYCRDNESVIIHSIASHGLPAEVLQSK